MTITSYHYGALASTRFTFELGESPPCPAGYGAVSSPAFAPQQFFLSVVPLLVRCCHALATICAGPGGKTRFRRLFPALTRVPSRHCCIPCGPLELAIRFWLAILRPSIMAWPALSWWRFATWPVACCLVGSGLSPSGDLTGRRAWL